MCKIIFFSCFVVISNVFTRFINDSVSLRIEPLTVRNCLPWIYHLSTWILKRPWTPSFFSLLNSFCRGIQSIFRGSGWGGGGTNVSCLLGFSKVDET